ncbi:interleukin-27 subunit beta [Bombina bombina]|uniref:interleukin-27 subunit beta n=1 Tax=Bombina bombina TaxID=8345 RepID=UPI00235AADC9|nr:interleukin-27 subunit beta [Bombina bombina]
MISGSWRMTWASFLAVTLLLSREGVAYKVSSVQYERLRTNITLQCNTILSIVEWRLNGSRIKNSEYVLQNENQLTLLNVQQDQRGNYSCHQLHTNQILTQIELQLGYPPDKLHIQCWAMSYPEKIRCKWDLHPDTHLPTIFTTTYSLGLKGPDYSCVQSKDEPNSCLINDFQMFANLPYVLKVNATNPLGSIMNGKPFIVENIIRPDPPEDLSLTPIIGQRRMLHLRWRPPRTWPLPEYFPLKYRIRYKKVGRGAFIIIGDYEQTSFNLTGIRPGTVLQVQVAAKEFMDYGNYSDWSSVVTGKSWMPSQVHTKSRI